MTPHFNPIMFLSHSSEKEGEKREKKEIEEGVGPTIGTVTEKNESK